MSEMPNEAPITQSKMFKALVPVFILSGILILLGTMLYFKDRHSRPEHEASVKLQVGSQFPDFPLAVFPEGEKKLSSLGNRVTLVNFWASWCAACLEEMPSILKAREKLKEKGFGVVLVNLDEKPKEAAPKWLKRFSIDFETYWDREQKLADYIDIHAIPITLILDSKLKVLHIEPGDRDWASSRVLKQLNEWLNNS